MRVKSSAITLAGAAMLAAACAAPVVTPTATLPARAALTVAPTPTTIVRVVNVGDVAVPTATAAPRAQAPAPTVPAATAAPRAPAPTPTPPAAAPTPLTRRITRIGERGHVATSDHRPAPVSVDDAAWDALFAALNARDDVGLQQLIRAGKVLMVAEGTEVLVLKNGLESVQVRLIDGPHAGQSGWVLRQDLG